MIYQFIQSQKKAYPVQTLCKAMGVARSGFYMWCDHKPRPRKIANQKMMQQIREIFIDSRGTYGGRRVTLELKKKNWPFMRQESCGKTDAAIRSAFIS